MGGFHGGHSGGGHSGGFHGGSHSSSHYSSSSSNNSVPHVDGHLTRAYYHGGKAYYRPYYGASNGTPMTFVGALTLGITIMIIGAIFLLCCLKIETTATITKAQRLATYEVYDFKYEYGGNTYYGYGDDDFDYQGRMTILEGEQYSLYISPIFPSDYSFESTNAGCIFGGIIMTIGIGWAASAIMKRRKFQEQLKEIGDVNGDGKINEADLLYEENKAEGTAEGAYQGAKKATAENIYHDLRTINCPYCNSKIDSTAAFCNNCGGRISKKETE